MFLFTNYYCCQTVLQQQQQFHLSNFLFGCAHVCFSIYIASSLIHQLTMLFLKNNETELRKLALKLFEIEAFKFGDFKMKVGVNSPVYFDLRVIVSFPDVMETLSKLLATFMKSQNLSFDHVCGVPYTALPLATILSVNEKIPMLIRRKEAKAYGTKKLIEGRFQPNDRCLIIEDVVTSGSSILETVNDLTEVGIKVTDVIVVVDREQGGMANIEDQHVKTHSLFSLSYLLGVLQEEGKVTAARVESVRKYISSCQVRKDGSPKNDDVTVGEFYLLIGLPFPPSAS